MEWNSVLWVCGNFLWLKTQFEEGITPSLRKVSFKHSSGITTLLLNIKTPVQKTFANMKFYQYILLCMMIVFRNLADPFYSLSFIDAYLNIKRPLNFGGTQYNRNLSPLNKWQLFQSKWLCITIEWILISESNTYLELTAQHPKENGFFFFKHRMHNFSLNCPTK